MLSDEERQLKAIHAELALVDRIRGDATQRIISLEAEVATLFRRAEAAEQRLATVTPLVEAVAEALVRTPQYSDPVLAWDSEYERDYEEPPAYAVREQARAWLASQASGDGEAR